MRAAVGLLCGLLACFFMAGTALADPIDLWENFPDTQGDNSFWALSLPWNNTGEGSYIKMDDMGAYMFGTANETVANVPYIYRGDDPRIRMYPSADGGANGTGLEYANPIYTYKVLEAGTGMVDITGTFEKGGTGDTHVFVKHNTEFLWNHTFMFSDPVGTQANFTLSDVMLNVKDEIYFGVGCGGSQKNFNDLTFLSGRINAVPEPVSCVLFLVGAGVFGAAARKRRKV